MLFILSIFRIERNGNMEKKVFKVTASEGLHARPANLLVKTAGEFQSSVTISNGEREVDCKRLLAVMTLGAKYNDDVTITAEGPDEIEAMQALTQLFNNKFIG